MNQKVASGFGVVLLVIIAVQSVFIYRMSGKVDRLSHEDTTVLEPNIQSGNTVVPKIPVDPLGKDNWNPFEEMQRMQNEMNKIFGDMRANFYLSPGFEDMFKPFSFSPTLDMQEKDDKFIIKIDIPGADESNINVKIENQQLTVSAATRKSGSHSGNGNTFRSERIMGQFERSVVLPAPVLAEKMKTEYKDGVLIITVPKA